MDRLAVAAHKERLKMISEGLDVHMPPTDPEKAFMLGLEPWPYKKDPVCEHEWYPDGTTQEHCPKCGLTRPCA